MRAMIRFGKQPRLRFISHLDLQRFFQRALNRTGLPIAWTQGFNPHPILSFGSALALGWTSEYEILDVKLSAPMGRKRTEEAMRAALPVDLPVLEVRMVDDRHPAPMAMVRASDYEITLSGETAAATLDAAEEFLRRESVMAMRKTKSGEREVDIRPMALSLKREGDVLSARLRHYGATGFAVEVTGDNTVRVSLPNTSDLDMLKTLLVSVGQINFTDADGNVLFDNNDIASADVQVSGGYSFLQVKMTEEGKAKLTEATEKCMGKTMPIVLDGEQLAAPQVDEVNTTGGMSLSFGFTESATRAIAAMMAG